MEEKINRTTRGSQLCLLWSKSHLLRKLEHLGLGGTRVTEQQHINVATQAHAIVQDFGGA
jgi:hypothetical protein